MIAAKTICNSAKMLSTTYAWRGIQRNVLIATATRHVEEVLLNWWTHISTVSMDCEYLRDSNEPAIVSLSFSPTFALIWHRPDPEKSREMPERFAQLLTSPRYPKVGFSIDDDLRKLAASTDLLGRGWPRSILDIQTVYRTFCQTRDADRAVSMADVVNALALSGRRETFEKMKHCGDWGLPRLTDDQIRYAANDVFIVWEVLHALSTRLALPDPSVHAHRRANDADHRTTRHTCRGFHDRRPFGAMATNGTHRGDGNVASMGRRRVTANETRGEGPLVGDDVVGAVVEFLAGTPADALPRPERLANCSAVARLPTGERRKAATAAQVVRRLFDDGHLIARDDRLTLTNPVNAASRSRDLSFGSSGHSPMAMVVGGRDPTRVAH
jgi:hypothetical protein